MTEFFSYYVGPDAKERCASIMQNLPEAHPILESIVLHVPDPRFPGAPVGAWGIVTSTPVDLPGFRAAEASSSAPVPRNPEQLLSELQNLREEI